MTLKIESVELWQTEISVTRPLFAIQSVSWNLKFNVPSSSVPENYTIWMVPYVNNKPVGDPQKLVIRYPSNYTNYISCSTVFMNKNESQRVRVYEVDPSLPINAGADFYESQEYFFENIIQLAPNPILQIDPYNAPFDLSDPQMSIVYTNNNLNAVSIFKDLYNVTNIKVYVESTNFVIWEGPNPESTTMSQHYLVFNLKNCTYPDPSLGLVGNVLVETTLVTKDASAIEYKCVNYICHNPKFLANNNTDISTVTSYSPFVTNLNNHLTYYPYFSGVNPSYSLHPTTRQTLINGVNYSESKPAFATRNYDGSIQQINNGDYYFIRESNPQQMEFLMFINGIMEMKELLLVQIKKI